MRIEKKIVCCTQCGRLLDRLEILAGKDKCSHCRQQETSPDKKNERERTDGAQ